MSIYEEIYEKLEIIKVKDLKHHEERVPHNLLRLKEAMLNIGQIVDPIIVDKKTNIVLDGNHRLKVLELIKVPYSVCQMVDYKGEEITLGSWFPVRDKITKEQLEGIGLRLEETDYEDGKEKIQNKEALFMLVNGEGEKSCYLVEPKKYELDELVEEQQRIMSLLDDNTFDYIADDRIDIELKKRRSVFCRYIYKKEEVIERALAGKAFPPKSTRHLIPDRIIRLNMRLGWLHQEPHESKEYLKNLLKNRAYNGNVRRYVEPVIVIY